ncbi:MAG: hypothetical protein WD059_02380 [Balneolaceae bacterium]
MCQSVGSIWTVGAIQKSTEFAVEALKLAFTHLEDAVNASTKEARKGMAMAAHYSGKAINISKTTANRHLYS